jgi:hypothetical protein
MEKDEQNGTMKNKPSFSHTQPASPRTRHESRDSVAPNTYNPQYPPSIVRVPCDESSAPSKRVRRKARDATGSQEPGGDAGAVHQGERRPHGGAVSGGGDTTAHEKGGMGHRRRDDGRRVGTVLYTHHSIASGNRLFRRALHIEAALAWSFCVLVLSIMDELH